MTQFFLILDHFLPLYPLTTQNQNFEKWKKTPGDIIILPKCTKYHDHVLYCSWDMARDACNFYFSFWAIFALLPPNSRKNQNQKKKFEQTSGNIIILHICTKNYDQMM